MAGIPKGWCPKCRQNYVGWALNYPSHQMCLTCGIILEINDDEALSAEVISTTELTSSVL